MVPPQRNSPEGKAHSGSPECDSGQTIQAQSGDSDRMVPVSASVQSLVLQLGPSRDGPLCNPVQPQTSQVCVTGSGSGSLGCRHPQHTMGESGCLRLSSGLIAQSSGVEGNGSGLLKDGSNCSNWPNMPWFWDLVNLSVQIPFQLPLHKELVTQPLNGLLHKNLANLNLHVWLLEPRPFKSKGSLMKWQQELRLLREAQPEPFINRSGPFLSNGVTQ